MAAPAMPPAAGAGISRPALPPVGKLFADTWAVIKTKWLVFVLIELITGGASLVYGFAGNINPALGVVAYVVYLGASIFFPMCLLFAVSKGTTPISVGAAIKGGWSMFGRFLWIYTLLAFFTFGAFMLLGIPGIIFAVWFYFALFVASVENEGGTRALLKSREYVRGYWWAVVGRSFLMGIVMLGIIMLLLALLGILAAAGAGFLAIILGALSYIVMVLFLSLISMSFGYALYTHLYAATPQSVIEQRLMTSKKTIYTVAILGWVLGIILLVSGAFAFVKFLKPRLPGIQQFIQEQQQINPDLTPSLYQ